MMSATPTGFEPWPPWKGQGCIDRSNLGDRGENDLFVRNLRIAGRSAHRSFRVRFQPSRLHWPPQPTVQSTQSQTTMVWAPEDQKRGGGAGLRPAETWWETERLVISVLSFLVVRHTTLGISRSKSRSWRRGELNPCLKTILRAVFGFKKLLPRASFVRSRWIFGKRVVTAE